MTAAGRRGGSGGGGHFNPNQPRDRNGRWIETGDTVDLPGGKSAKVVGKADGGRVKVDLGEGRIREIAGRQVEKSDGRREPDWPDIADGPDVERDVIDRSDFHGSEAEREALDRYIGPDYGRINELLRRDPDADIADWYGDPDDPDADFDFDEALRDTDTAKFVDDINDLFEAHPPLPRDVTVMRGLGESSWLPSGDLAGKQIVNKGFVSTTFDPDAADRFFKGDTRMEVRVPKGTKALPVAGVMGEDFLNEHELVLQHGTIFDVVSDETRTVGGRRVRWLTAVAKPPTRETARVPGRSE